MHQRMCRLTPVSATSTRQTNVFVSRADIAVFDVSGETNLLFDYIVIFAFADASTDMTDASADASVTRVVTLSSLFRLYFITDITARESVLFAKFTIDYRNVY